ncbi:MAG: UDP-N-acetylmuramoyl-L-alanine--D-glutamate ligase [Firmicutes bacterium]|nr:UDP-N-acetylmuramoyl-L-alanine--D-glutamate ligase [Bacillota bacterium]
MIGLAKSGISAANFCFAHGAVVTVYDSKPEEQLKEAMEKVSCGVKVLCGTMPGEADLEQMDLMVLSPAVPADLPFVLRAKERSIPVYSEIELAYHFLKGSIIGITGTNGKTTTTSLVGEICGNYRKGSVTAGNIGLPLTDALSEVEDNGFAVLELSSFQLECIDDFRPHVAALLNFTPDHLNRHHTFEAYVDAKCRIYENQTEEDYCIFNYDDPICLKKAKELMERAHAPRVRFFSHNQITENGIWTKDGMIFADVEGEAVPVVKADELQILGDHNIENAMAAALCLLSAGIPMDVIRQGLKAFRGVPHRIEPVGCVNGVRYFNDSKGTNPDAAIKGLLSMPSEKTVLIGGGYDKGTPYDDWCSLFEKRVRYLVLIGQTAEDIKACALRHGFDEARIFMEQTFDDAIERCRQMAVPGDSVLLSPACASWGMFDNYEQRGDIFREKVKQMEAQANA